MNVVFFATLLFSLIYKDIKNYNCKTESFLDALCDHTNTLACKPVNIENYVYKFKCVNKFKNYPKPGDRIHQKDRKFLIFDKNCNVRIDESENDNEEDSTAFSYNDCDYRSLARIAGYKCAFRKDGFSETIIFSVFSDYKDPEEGNFHLFKYGCYCKPVCGNELKTIRYITNQGTTKVKTIDGVKLTSHFFNISEIKFIFDNTATISITVPIQSTRTSLSLLDKNNDEITKFKCFDTSLIDNNETTLCNEWFIPNKNSPFKSKNRCLKTYSLNIKLEDLKTYFDYDEQSLNYRAVVALKNQFRQQIKTADDYLITHYYEHAEMIPVNIKNVLNETPEKFSDPYFVIRDYTLSLLVVDQKITYNEKNNLIENSNQKKFDYVLNTELVARLYKNNKFKISKVSVNPLPTKTETHYELLKENGESFSDYIKCDTNDDFCLVPFSVNLKLQNMKCITTTTINLQLTYFCDKKSDYYGAHNCDGIIEHIPDFPIIYQFKNPHNSEISQKLLSYGFNDDCRQIPNKIMNEEKMHFEVFLTKNEHVTIESVDIIGIKLLFMDEIEVALYEKGEITKLGNDLSLTLNENELFCSGVSRSESASFNVVFDLKKLVKMFDAKKDDFLKIIVDSNVGFDGGSSCVVLSSESERFFIGETKPVRSNSIKILILV